MAGKRRLRPPPGQEDVAGARGVFEQVETRRDQRHCRLGTKGMMQPPEPFDHPRLPPSVPLLGERVQEQNALMGIGRKRWCLGVAYQLSVQSDRILVLSAACSAAPHNEQASPMLSAGG